MKTDSHTHQKQHRWPTAFQAIAVCLAMIGSLFATTPVDAAVSPVTSPGSDTTSPILMATADCTPDGVSSHAINFVVRNVDAIAHDVQLDHGGQTIATFTVGAGQDYSDIVNTAGSGQHKLLQATYVNGAGAGNQSLPMFIRPNRCLGLNSNWQLDAPLRVNGPQGNAGLECRSGVLHVVYDFENGDDQPQDMAVRLYAVGLGGSQSLTVAGPQSVPAGSSLSGAVPFPYEIDGDDGTVVFPSSHTGTTLIRGWFDDPADHPTDDYHSRTWYQDTPQCDAAQPSTPGRPGLVDNGDGTVTVSWAASSDNVGVASYNVLRNLVPVATVGGSVTSVTVSLPQGDSWIQVQAFDAAGNSSNRSQNRQITL